MDQVFKAIIPVELEKGSEEGEWKIRGLASTNSKDRQGEIVLQDGLDLSPIHQKRGVFNWDHKSGPENMIGFIDGARKTVDGLLVEGRLLKNHDKAKAIHQIMSSLGKSDRGRVGMSVEGVIQERIGEDKKIIKKAIIKAVALTLNPVNEDTYVDLAKSLGTEAISFEESYPLAITEDMQKSLTEDFQKDLGVSGAYATSTPAQLEGGDALSMESLDHKKKKKKLKKMDSIMAKSLVGDVLNRIQTLYPEYSRVQLWEIFKDRLNRKFPDLSADK